MPASLLVEFGFVVKKRFSAHFRYIYAVGEQIKILDRVLLPVCFYDEKVGIDSNYSCLLILQMHFWSADRNIDMYVRLCLVKAIDGLFECG